MLAPRPSEHRFLERCDLSNEEAAEIPEIDQEDTTTSSSDDRIIRGDEAIICTTPALLHKPASSTSRLCLNTVHLLDRLRLTGSWFELIPSRLGFSPVVDFAVEAFVKRNTPAFQSGAVAPSGAFQSYGKAIQGLQRCISNNDEALSDKSLLACSLLAYCHHPFSLPISPRLKEEPLKYALSHLYGIQAILTSLPPRRQPSEFTLALLSWHIPLLLDIPVSLGIVSPFEHIKWFDWQPEDLEVPSAQITKLKRIAHRIFLRLPRLIMYMRAWRGLSVTAGSDQRKAMQATTTLARDFLGCKGASSENLLLHQISVIKTTDPPTAEVVPYSFCFTSLAYFEAAISYWQSRALILRICLRIGNYDSYDKTALCKEGLRTARNLLMSWQYGFEKGVCGRVPLLYSIPATWGAITEFDGQSSPTKLERRLWLERSNEL